MSLKKSLLFTVIGFTVFAETSVAIIKVDRCDTFKDNLNTEQAAGRRAWASKCFPSFRGLIRSHDEFEDSATKNRFAGYPTFGILHEDREPTNPSEWKAPTSVDAPCSYPRDYQIAAFCVASGCYTPEQKILFDDGYHAIMDAQKAQLKNIRTLSDDSTLDVFDFITNPVEHFIADLIEGEQTILNFEMASGGKLRVTENHPIVDGEGRMRSADTLRVGESLVKNDGNHDPIVSIVKEQYFGKVYNVEVKTDSLMQKIVIAQGYLNGSLYFQNEGVKNLNRVLLRTALIHNDLVR